MNDIKHLEMRITEAIDGLLDERALAALESDLRRHPELLSEFRAQMQGLPVRLAYEAVQPDPFAVGRLRQKMRAAREDQWQYDVIRIFKRYVVAAGLGIILVVGALHAIPGSPSETDYLDDEITTLFESLEQDALSWSVQDNDPQPK